jgi:hypothetical protein
MSSTSDSSISDGYVVQAGKPMGRKSSLIASKKENYNTLRSTQNEWKRGSKTGIEITQAMYNNLEDLE